MNSKPLRLPSPRERQILECYAEGLGDKQIALKYNISTDTAKRHGQVVRFKLEATNRAHAVAIAFRNKILT